ncbi:hypothetical protein BH10CHL1_BH10CHL1_39460 [soil metagenome]
MIELLEEETLLCVVTINKQFKEGGYHPRSLSLRSILVRESGWRRFVATE